MTLRFHWRTPFGPMGLRMYFYGISIRGFMLGYWDKRELVGALRRESKPK